MSLESKDKENFQNEDLGHGFAILSNLNQAHRNLLGEAKTLIRTPNTALFWSSVGAGFAIAFSFLAEAAGYAAAPEGWGKIIGTLVYPVGFAIIVLGRYQLFTEQTLLPVALVLERVCTIPKVLRLWSTTLTGNIIGASLVASILAWDKVLPESIYKSALHAAQFNDEGLSVICVRAIMAGWLVAEMVWLIHQTKGRGALAIVWVLMAMIPLMGLEHIVIGTVEAVFLLWGGQTELIQVISHLSVVTLGNIIGGVVFVALLHHARTKNLKHNND